MHTIIAAILIAIGLIAISIIIGAIWLLVAIYKMIAQSESQQYKSNPKP